MKNKQFFYSSPWTWKEMSRLLIFVLIMIPILIEYLLNGYLTTILQNELYSGTLTGLIMSILFLLGVYVVALRPNNLSWKEVGLTRFSSRYWGAIIGWTIALIVASIALVLLMELLFGIGTDNTKTESLQSRLTPTNLLIGFVSAAIISPFYEEIFYRGLLYRFFRSKYGVRVGIFVSSFIFMIVHIPTFNTLPVNFVTGIVFAWTYEKSGSVIPGMIIHGIFNGLAVILTALG